MGCFIIIGMFTFLAGFQWHGLWVITFLCGVLLWLDGDNER